MLLGRAAAPLLASLWTVPRVCGPFACAPVSTLAPQLGTWVEKALAAEQRKRSSLTKEADTARKAEKLGQWATRMPHTDSNPRLPPGGSLKAQFSSLS